MVGRRKAGARRKVGAKVSRKGARKTPRKIIEEKPQPSISFVYEKGVSETLSTGSGRSVEAVPEGRRISLIKFPGNPVIAPNSLNSWEMFQTFNAGAVLLDGKVHLLYRAIGLDGISRFGYAVSSDGFKIDERLPRPVYERKMEKLSYSPSSSGGGFGGCEDPRMVVMKEDNKIYVTYNAFGPYELRVGLTSIRISDFMNRVWRWSEERLISPPGEVHKNFVLFPEKINGRYAILHSITPKIMITYLDSLDFHDGIYLKSQYKPNSNGNGWEAVVKSPGPPPIKTDMGWLLFYHGLDRREPWKYKVGAMLLDLDNPEKILAVSRCPVIEANQPYENAGFKPGIVYANGAIVKDGELIVYYGSADTYVSAAHIPLNELLDYLAKEMELTQGVDKEKLLLMNGLSNSVLAKSCV